MTLLFFTSSFPYGKAETFIENEIEFLAAKFETVYVFPMLVEGEKRSCPNNVKIVNLQDNSGKIKVLSKNLSLLLPEYAILFKKLISRNINYPQFRYFISLFNRYLQKAESLKNWLGENNIKDAVYYSYWFDDWATILAILRKKNVIPEFHSRAHGFDVYEERQEFGFLPFRLLQLSQVKTVSSVSKAGADYLQKRFPQFHNKIKVYRLGVKDHGYRVYSQEDKFTIVSCSNLISGKRVHLIIAILKQLSIPIHWIHFGDGVLMEEIKESTKELPATVTVDFKGRVSNAEIINFYKHNPVDLFITTTESEGIPVSIMEAISFGIPVLATAVGGVPEIVNENSGYLIDKVFNPKEAAEIIRKIASAENKEVLRKKTRLFWEENFEARKNFERYIEEVLLQEYEVNRSI